jgi:Fe-S cluster assembly protein SufD
VGAEIFTPEAAAGLPGPEWLAARRKAALGLVDDLPEPTSEMEEWRYSRIDELDLGRYSLAGPPAAGDVPPFAATVFEALSPLAGRVVLVNGRVVLAELDEEYAASGVALGSAAHPDAHHGVSEQIARDALGAAMARPHDSFAALNDAFAAEPVVISVPRGVTVDRPIAIVSVLDDAASGTVVVPRLSVLLGENSELPVIEVTASDDTVEALVLPVTELKVSRAARLRHSAVQDLGQRAWQIGSLVADVEADATLDSSFAALGGDYARLRLDCLLSGRGATGNLSSVYFGDGSQMLDLRTFQDHRAPDTTSNLLFKGAVADSSHSVYTGLIHIFPEARGSNAFQTNRNLKLSDDAWAESVPNLEIENNEVHCSHASTVGPVDPDQRFYLESRGVPTEIAERLVVAGFFDEVLESLPVPSLSGPVRERIDHLLDRQVGPLTHEASA